MEPGPCPRWLPGALLCGLDGKSRVTKFWRPTRLWKCGKRKKRASHIPTTTTATAGSSPSSNTTFLLLPLRRLDSQQGRRSADAADAEGIRAFLSPRSPKRNRLEQAEWDRLEREKQEQAKRARLDQERQGQAEQERLEYERKDRAEQGGWKASGRRGLSTSGRLRQRKRFLNDLC